jgi:hypothetical protein
MNKYGLTLVAEMPVLYKNLIQQNGFIPKIFTLVNEDGDQYVFYLDNLNLEREIEGDLYQYILKTHNAIAYARGFLAALESGDQQIYIVVVGKNDQLGVQLVAPIQRDEGGVISNVGEYRIDPAPKEKLTHGWWFDEKEFADGRLEQLSGLWNHIKSISMHRKMINFVNDYDKS